MPSTRDRQAPLAPDDPRLAEPLYTLAQSSEYLGVPYTTLRSWARGKSALITCLPKEGHQATIPFIGFAEAFVLAAVKRAGVPVHRIRPGVEAVKQELGIEHALASRRLYTDGAEILVKPATEESEDLEVARTRQQQLTDTVKSQLELITYGADDYATRLQLPTYAGTTVVADPTVAFGYPLIETADARVKDVVDRFVAGESISDIAYDFSLPAEEVEAVIRPHTHPLD
jgi:uncharacterized protein (DUF433 family)